MRLYALLSCARHLRLRSRLIPSENLALWIEGYPASRERNDPQQTTQPRRWVSAHALQNEDISRPPRRGAQIGVSELHLFDPDFTAHVGPSSSADVLDGVRTIARRAFKQDQVAGTGVHEKEELLPLNLHFDDSVTRASPVWNGNHWQSNEAVREAQIGNAVAARQQARTALSLAPGRDVRVLAALAVARVGDLSQAQKLADQLNADFPLDTLIQSYWLPTIRAEIKVYGDKGDSAVELLRSTAPYELGEPPAITSCLYAVYVRGEAYLRAHEGEAAKTEFRKIIQHRGIVQNRPVGALARLGLARAYRLSGDTATARAAYSDFLTLWKDADPDIPVLKEAKAEYAKLQ